MFFLKLRLIPTTLVKAVDFHLVDVAWGRAHPQPNVGVFGHNCRLTDFRISVPITKHVNIQ